MIKFTYSGQGFQHWSAQALKNFSPTLLQRMFYDMLCIRRTEEKIAYHYHEDQMKTPIHLAIGQEAISVGVCAALKQEDEIFCSYRSHGHYLAKGGNLQAMISELHCRIDGCVASRGGSMHLLDKSVGMMGCSAIVGGIVPIATGNALAHQLRQESHVTVAFLGDAAMEQGVVWESLNFAALKKLPILYVCENNYYAVCSPLENRQPLDTKIYQKVNAFGLRSQCIDGNNVLEVHQAAQEAVNHIRSGKGPAFIEAQTYRWLGHHGGEDDSYTGYRDPNEVKYWYQFDPVERYFEFLAENHLISAQERQNMENQISAELEKVFRHALQSPEPGLEDLYTYAYSH